METVKDIWSSIVDFLKSVGELFTTTLFKLGQSEISLGTIIYFIIAFVILSFISKRVRNILINKVLVRANVEAGARNSVNVILQPIF